MSPERRVDDERRALDDVVASALRTPGYAAMRPGIVKEVLHYDMLFALQREGLLDGLTFQGGTALRARPRLAAPERGSRLRGRKGLRRIGARAHRGRPSSVSSATGTASTSR